MNLAEETKEKKRITRRRAGTKKRVVNRDFSTDTGVSTQNPSMIDVAIFRQ
jgi:hypothetical protein